MILSAGLGLIVVRDQAVFSCAQEADLVAECCVIGQVPQTQDIESRLAPARNIVFC